MTGKENGIPSNYPDHAVVKNQDHGLTITRELEGNKKRAAITGPPSSMKLSDRKRYVLSTV